MQIKLRWKSVNDIIALVGNANCGKTTLFNTLTGLYQKTGNWAGVTVEKKEGDYKKDKRIKIYDLPGLYSLSAQGEDEKAVLECFSKTPPKVIINVVDGTNLERNLFLTVQLVSLGLPLVIAINMYDDLKKNGIKIDTQKLSKLFGVPVIPISALKKFNIDKLIDIAKECTTIPKIESFNVIEHVKNQDYIYSFIEKNLSTIYNKKQTKSQRFTEKADKLLTHKFFGLPIFFCVITIMYFVSMKIGGFMGKYVSEFFYSLSERISGYFIQKGMSIWITDLICNAIIKGLGTVFSFLPNILVLFALLSVIEESGYASRIAFILDRLFRSFGLSGKSIIPMILSCGCTVSGLMSTRTIENKSEKRMTVFLSPFMPCGAKTAVFAWISCEFFGGSALVATSMYFLGIISAMIFGKILKKFKSFKTEYDAFILEMPTMRLPSVNDVFYTLWEKVKEFTIKAGLIVFVVTVGLWVLNHFGFDGYTTDSENSFLYIIGNLFKYVFRPLGFGNWQATVAMLSSLLAKEAVVESLSFVSVDVHSLFDNGFSVYAFMAFLLLSPPCSASIATAKRELGSAKWLWGMIAFQFISAYSVALIINGIGFLINGASGLLLTVIIAIITLIAVVFSVLLLKKHKCTDCTVCRKGNKCIKHNTI